MHKMIISLSILTLLSLVACATRTVNQEAQTKVTIVKELPSDKKCTSAGVLEVKDVLESSAIEEVKNLAFNLGGNFVIIKESQSKPTYVIHKAEAFICK